MRFLFFSLPVIFLFSFCREKKPMDAAQNTVPTFRELTYDELKKSIDSTKNKFRTAAGNKKKLSDSLLNEARSFLVKTIGEHMFSYWRGTGWDFNGTTTIPRKGNIACGHFVTTLIRDIGYPINRVKLAICPSLVMMKSLTSGNSIQNVSSLGFDGLLERIRSYGPNVFVIGLDYHTGFIVNDGKESWFIHSNYINKEGVVKEKLSDSKALQFSKTRYITCITESTDFLSRWIFS